MIVKLMRVHFNISTFSTPWRFYDVRTPIRIGFYFCWIGPFKPKLTPMHSTNVPTSTSRCRTMTRLWRLVVSQSVVILLPFLSVIYVARNLAMGCSWTNFFRLNAETPIYIEMLSIFGMGVQMPPLNWVLYWSWSKILHFITFPSQDLNKAGRLTPYSARIRLLNEKIRKAQRKILVNQLFLIILS
jgi:hypothetical protein